MSTLIHPFDYRVREEMIFIIYLICLIGFARANVNVTEFLESFPSHDRAKYLGLQRKLVQDCLSNEKECSYFKYAKQSKYACWGYEVDCEPKIIAHCPQISKLEEAEAKENFWKNADFGYVAEKMDGMQDECLPGESSLVCTKNKGLCIASNVILDFTVFSERDWERFRKNPSHISNGLLKASCSLDPNVNHAEGIDQFLYSWIAVLKSFETVTQNQFQKCDIYLDSSPVFFLQLERKADFNIRIGDLISLYVSQHLTNRFDPNIQIINWGVDDQLNDEYQELWKAFSKQAFQSLNEFKNKVVCIKEAVFSNVPRSSLGMIHNFPNLNFCQKSSMYESFKFFFLHRMGIVSHHHDTIQSTYVEHTPTESRQITNSADLAAHIHIVLDHMVLNEVIFSEVSLKEEVEIAANTHIYIAMHGPSLVHQIFMPPDGYVFEIYNCGDSKLYKDLAAVMGHTYLTLSKQYVKMVGDETNLKEIDANYTVDRPEFIRTLIRTSNALSTRITAFKDEL